MSREARETSGRAAETPLPKCADPLVSERPDPVMRGRVARMLQEIPDAEWFFDRAIQGVAASLRTNLEPAPGDRVGSYRILSQIGRGGMGTVYLAERADGEIEQRVAIKLLGMQTSRPGWRERFLRERQLLAALQHPAVVHVIDAGHTGEGRPFLVMEYVDGVRIDGYATGIGMRERLKLFVRVCEGVSHAHRRLIIHRDLKPSNILVDKAGQPKLLDFGIAKLQTDGDDATRGVEKLLTPSYASPEQLRGETETTATDVYSLGAVLYKLLTGTLPAERKHAPGTREWPPPSRINPDVPRDLDFVLAKALREEPEHRYRSVDEFAGDVRAVLERRPVLARSGETWYRTLRYLRRYWAPVAASLLVVASLSGAMLLAERQRRIAERRFGEVRQLANKLFQIDRQVAQLPGGSRTRQLIVDTALDYLRRLTTDVEMQPDLALELGTAYMRVARVQGVNISPNLGQTLQADATEGKAQELIDSVLASQPANQTALLRAGQIAHDRMILAGDENQDAQALKFARTAIDRLDQYLRANRNGSYDHAEAQQVILALINIANRYVRANQPDEAIRICERAIGLAKATDWPTQAGAAEIVMAMAHRERGELDEALVAVREAIRLLRPEPGEASTGRLQTYGLALLREGQILDEPHYISLNRAAAAIASLEQTLALGRQLAERDANDFQSQYRVFHAEAKLAGILWRRDPRRALEMYDDGLHRLAATASNAGTLRNEATTLAASTYPLLLLGRRREARERLDRAFADLKQLREYPSAKIKLGSPGDQVVRALAGYEAAGGNYRRAAAVYTELVLAVQAGGPEPRANLQEAVSLSEIYHSAASLQMTIGNRDVAAGLESQRLELWSYWAAKLPGNAFVRRQLEAVREGP